MKAILVCLAVCLMALATKAQQLSLNAIKPNGPNKYFNNNVDAMPIAPVGPASQTLLYNNGLGFNQYKSQPDNMPVQKPDASFKDDMGVGNSLHNNKTAQVHAFMDSLQAHQSLLNLQKPNENQVPKAIVPRNLLKSYTPQY